VRKNRFKIILISATILLCVWFLYPTYQNYNLTKALEAVGPDSAARYIENHEKQVRKIKSERLKLGLDLQGGMRVVLEVDLMQLLEKRAKNVDDTFKGVINDVRQEAKLSEEQVVNIFRRKFEERGIRLSRYYGDIRDNNDKIVSNLTDESSKAVDRAMEIIRNRVDQYGVSEPAIQKQGGRRVIVELPGVANEREVRELLQGTALLEFKLVKDNAITAKVYENIDKILAGKIIEDTTKADSSNPVAEADSSKKDSSKSDSSNVAQDTALASHPFMALFVGSDRSGDAVAPDENKRKIGRILDREDVKRVIPGDVVFQWSAKGVTGQDGRKYFTLYAVEKNPELTGGVITDARGQPDPEGGTPIVTMDMNSEGSRDWARITGANIGKRCAVVLDSVIYSAPTIQSKIPNGKSRITGMGNMEEAKLLEIVLKAGALPAPVEIAEQRSVGPSLGEDSIKKGVISGAGALLAIVFFMLVYYRTGGVTADIALIVNVLYVLGILASFRATLTLPGIAGIILTLGMAVDANVLIYERIREELSTGKTQRAAIDTGYSRAFTAVIDTHMTGIITGVILYQFGTGPVQGFALTLIIGLAASLFSAVVITHVIFNVMLDRGSTHINIG
jgi:preprotein translocase subunit SecD